MTPENEIKVVTALATIQTTLKNQDKVLSKLDYTINGNGVPGLKTTVDRHDKTLKFMRRISWIVLTAILAEVGTGLVAASVYLIRHTQETPHEVPFSVPGRNSGSGSPRVQPVPSDQHPVVAGTQ